MPLSRSTIYDANRWLAILLLLLTAGCAGTKIHIPNTPEPNQTYDMSRGKTIVGQAGGFQLLIFFPISINDRQERAYHQLLAQADGGFITDVKVKESWTYGFIGTVYRTTLTATVYPRSMASVSGLRTPPESMAKTPAANPETHYSIDDFRIVDYAFDAKSGNGTITVDIGNKGFQARLWVVKNIGIICSSKRAALDAGNETFTGAKYNILDESIKEGLLKVTFQVVY